MRVLIKLGRHRFSMLIEANVEHNKVQDQCIIFNNSMLHMGSKDSSIKEVREQKIKDKGDLIPLKIRY